MPEELFAAIREIVTPEEMEVAVFTDEKQIREENIRNITAKLEEAFADKEEWLSVLGEAIYQYQKKTVRKMILKDHKRPDGRAMLDLMLWHSPRPMIYATQNSWKVLMHLQISTLTRPMRP